MGAIPLGTDGSAAGVDTAIVIGQAPRIGIEGVVRDSKWLKEKSLFGAKGGPCESCTSGTSYTYTLDRAAD